ncbi:MAG TPA: acyltransferase [Chroococcales cyanobacterium]
MSNRSSIEALTGVRALAAWWVVLFHASKSGLSELLGPLKTVLEPLTSAGYIGVDLFFILSGFVIAYNYADTFREGIEGKAYLRFLWLRLARLYPVHLFGLLLLALILILSQALRLPLNHAYSADAFLRHVALIHAWYTNEQSWNYPAWSISHEWLAYILFPALMLLFRRIKRPLSQAVLILVLLLAMPALVVGYRVEISRILCEFPAGCLLCALFRQNLGAGIRWQHFEWPLLLLLLGFAMVVERFSPGAAVSSALLAALLLYALSWQRGSLSRLLARKGMMFWGKVSYSLYMTHAIVDMILNKAFPLALRHLPAWGKPGLALCYFAAIAGMAIFTYRFIEVPARVWMCARGERKKKEVFAP